ncbi:MAG: hypothetical protein RMJ98_00730 [Myxococcales bacterium]|nr:hypothetical protein [Polyangiaceae bacterium]MDW8247810.1 hypothetical protein [Myxococcales bacterium]
MHRDALVRLAPALTLLLGSSVAQAEVTSWLFVGGGASRVELTSGSSPLRFHLPANLGVGLQPSLPVIVGIGVKIHPYFGEGLDYGAYLRAATQGYVLGGFGVALDAGGYLRSFDSEASGLMGILNLGIPWGGVISLNYGRSREGEQTLGATVGIDFLRLTVYRLSGEQQWPNVRPAWRP